MTSPLVQEHSPALFPARMPIEIRCPDSPSVIEGVIEEIHGRKIFFHTNLEVRPGNVVFVLSVPPEITLEPTLNIAGTGNVLQVHKQADCNYSVEMEIDEAAPLARAASHYPFANVRTPSTR